MLTQAEENYIKAIFHLSTTEENGISTNAIAQRMDTKASSVTDMIKKLHEKELIDYQKYQGVYLTESGIYTAKMIIRRHRLWEVFLVEKLQFTWDEVHDVAEELEHIKSEKLINKLDAYLGYPKEDPHGDPIPNAKGEMQTMNKVLLSEMQIGKPCICVGVKDTSTSFLQYLDRQNISLGASISILSKEDFDQSLTITVNTKEMIISKIVARNLFVKTV